MMRHFTETDKGGFHIGFKEAGSCSSLCSLGSGSHWLHLAVCAFFKHPQLRRSAWSQAVLPPLNVLKYFKVQETVVKAQAVEVHSMHLTCD